VHACCQLCACICKCAHVLTGVGCSSSCRVVKTLRENQASEMTEAQSHKHHSPKTVIAFA
jgi:hypothetical protein